MGGYFLIVENLRSVGPDIQSAEMVVWSIYFDLRGI
jgi:hypothetical protein